jgi:biotin carboxylase
MKSLLIAGGGYADIPLILAARKLGYYVISSGNRPDELGHGYSDEYQAADFSDKHAILELARSKNVDALCACCNDFSALSCAFAAEQLGLPGHDPFEVAEVIHHKDRYREFATRNGIATPRAMGFAGREEAVAGIPDLPYPVIIKPVDLTGGKGMSTVHEPQAAAAAIDKAFAISRTKRIVVEEFLTGSRHGFSAFVVDGRVVFFFSDNEHYYLNPYLVSAASVPSIAPPSVEQGLCDESERIVSLLSLKTGIFHIQYILRHGEPVIIEICRRAPGDLYVDLVKLATGVDYPAWIVRASAGLDCSGLEQVEPVGCFTRHCVMGSQAGRVKDVIEDSSIQSNIVRRFMWWRPGDVIEDAMTYKAGIVFLQFESRDEMIETTDRLQDLIRVVTE